MNRRSLLSGLIAAAAMAGKSHAARGVSLHEIAFDPALPVLGNPQGDVTIVEFFDYACPSCKAIHPQLKQMVATDGNIRLVMKDWPINGEIVLYAARMVLAASSLGFYEKAHVAVMNITTRALTHCNIDGALRDAGVAPAAVRDALDLNMAAIDALLERNRAHAARLQLIGTPSFLIGSRLYRGSLTPEQISSAVAAARHR